jgi:hypothetical protein
LQDQVAESANSVDTATYYNNIESPALTEPFDLSGARVGHSFFIRSIAAFLATSLVSSSGVEFCQMRDNRRVDGRNLGWGKPNAARGST